MIWSSDMDDWFPNMSAGDCIHILGKDYTTTGLYHLTMNFDDTPELSPNIVYDTAKTLQEARKKFTGLKKELKTILKLHSESVGCGVSKDSLSLDKSIPTPEIVKGI